MTDLSPLINNIPPELQSVIAQKLADWGLGIALNVVKQYGEQTTQDNLLKAYLKNAAISAPLLRLKDSYPLPAL